jgi:hypothetical protein
MPPLGAQAFIAFCWAADIDGLMPVGRAPVGRPDGMPLGRPARAGMVTPCFFRQSARFPAGALDPFDVPVDPFDVPVDPFDVPAALVPLFVLPPQAPVSSRAPTMAVPPSSLTIFIELISISPCDSLSDWCAHLRDMDRNQLYG